MIDFIYILIMIGWVMLLVSFYYKDYPIGAIGAMLLMAIGVYILYNGLPDANDFLNKIIGIIHCGIGGYVFIRGTWEQYKNY